MKPKAHVFGGRNGLTFSMAKGPHVFGGKRASRFREQKGLTFSAPTWWAQYLGDGTQAFFDSKKECLDWIRNWYGRAHRRSAV
jgi:hypothetical protein